MTVQHDRRRRACGSSSPYIGGAEDAVMFEQTVGIGKTAVGERKLGVLDNRTFEKLDGLPQTSFRPLIQVIAALNVEIARRQVFAASGPDQVICGFVELGVKPFDDQLGNRFLRRKSIVYCAID